MSPEKRGGKIPAGRRAAAGEIARLAEEAPRLARSDPKALEGRLAELALRDQLELALRTPAPDRLDLLLHAPSPMKLARMLPDFEAYLTVREVGPHDALPLLSLASASQITHLLDLEGWRGDRFDADRAGAWAALLLEAGEPTLVRFLRSADDEMLTLLLARWACVEPIPIEDTPSIHGTGETEAGTDRGFVTPDGHHRFRPTISEHAPAIRRIAEVFFRLDPERYWRLIWATQSEVAAELEEEALRWRQRRLEEHGFPDREEALSIYAPPARRQEPAPAPPRAVEEGAVAPRTALRLLADRGPLAEALGAFAGAEREEMLFQLASVANHVLVADGADAGDPETHRASIAKAGAYVGIALAARGASTPEGAADALRRATVKELFREGYARAAELQRRALSLVRHGWASGHPRALELLDVPIRPRVLGLLGARPAYFDPSPATGGRDYREFRSQEEIEETRIALEMAETLGTVFVEALRLDVESALRHDAGRRPEPPRFSALLLTALAWHAERGELRGSPLPRDAAAAFLAGGATRDALEAFVGRVSESAGLDPRRTAALLAFGRACLDRLGEECGSLAPGRLPDPRFVSCLILEGD